MELREISERIQRISFDQSFSSLFCLQMNITVKTVKDFFALLRPNSFEHSIFSGLFVFHNIISVLEN